MIQENQELEESETFRDFEEMISEIDEYQPEVKNSNTADLFFRINKLTGEQESVPLVRDLPDF